MPSLPIRGVPDALPAELPYLCLFAYSGYDVLRVGVATVDGPLDLTAPNCAWQPERMVVTKGER